MSVYIRRGTTFWLPTMAGSVRERNLRGTRWLTIVIAEGDHPEHVAAIAEGPPRGYRDRLRDASRDVLRHRRQERSET
jgi:hypothetical protein